MLVSHSWNQQYIPNIYIEVSLISNFHYPDILVAGSFMLIIDLAQFKRENQD